MSDPNSPYRANFNKNVWLSGYESTWFAEYKVLKLKELISDLVNKPISILDFGCGDGVMSSFVNHVFVHAEVFGVDQSAEAIEVARMAYEDVYFAVLEEKIPVADSSFDVVVAAEIFHHIPFKEHDYYVREMMRVLKPNGLLVLFELNPLNLMTVYRFKRNPLEGGMHMLFPWSAKKLLKQYGKIITLNFYSFFPHWLRKLYFLEQYMIKIPVGTLYAVVVQKQCA